MNRVLTFAVTGLLATGLGLSPMSARADQTPTGKSVTPAPAASTVSPGITSTQAGTQSAPTPEKKNDKAAATSGSTNAATSGTTAPASNGPATKIPAKGS